MVCSKTQCHYTTCEQLAISFIYEAYCNCFPCSSEMDCAEIEILAKLAKISLQNILNILKRDFAKTIRSPDQSGTYNFREKFSHKVPQIQLLVNSYGAPLPILSIFPFC